MFHFYKTLIDGIRLIDTVHPIFFEPSTGGNLVGGFKLGYNNPPGNNTVIS